MASRTRRAGSNGENVRRFSADHVGEWRETGLVLIEGYFRADEIAPVAADYQRLYGARRAEQVPEAPNRNGGSFNEIQFRNIDILPYAASVATTLISLHPALIDFWNERTLKLTQARWPDWDMQAYFR